MKSALFWLLVLYLCVPHHLLQLFGAGPELKLFDLVAACIFLLLLLSSFHLDPVYRIFLLFSAWYLVRSLFAVQHIGVGAVLYGVKFMEYFVVCVAVQKLDGRDLRRLLAWLAAAIVGYMVLELAGVRLTPTAWSGRGRLSAQFGGPYELGAVSLVLAIAAIHRGSNIVGALGVMLSVAKASIIGYCAFLARRMHDVRWAAAAVVIGAGAVLLAGSRLTEFFSASGFFLDTSMLRDVYDSVPVARNYDDYQTLWFDRADFSADLPVDASTGLRVYSYILAIKSLGLLDLLWGKGPGFFSLALDSSVLRVFVEAGLVGMLLLWRFLSRLFMAFAVKGLAIAVVLNLLFVDVLFSARFLVVLFVLYRAATVDPDERHAKSQS